MDLARFFGLRDTYSHAKLAAVLGTTAIYVAAVLALGPAGGSALMMVTVPVLLAAWSFGVRAALLASAVGFLLNGVLSTIFVGESARMWLSVNGLMGTSVLLAVGVTAGRLRDLSVRLKRELAEREAVTSALEQSEERLRAALDSMVDAVLIIDRRGRLTYLNPAAEQLFGYDRSEIVGDNVATLVPDPYRAPSESRSRRSSG